MRTLNAPNICPQEEMVPSQIDVLTPFWKSWEQKINWLAALVVEQRKFSGIVDYLPNQ